MNIIEKLELITSSGNYIYNLDKKIITSCKTNRCIKVGTDGYITLKYDGISLRTKVDTVIMYIKEKCERGIFNLVYNGYRINMGKMGLIVINPSEDDKFFIMNMPIDDSAAYYKVSRRTINTIRSVWNKIGGTK